MINYIRDYGITNDQLNYILSKLSNTSIEELILSEKNVRKVLKFYNDAGIVDDLHKIFLNRIDLILIPLDSLRELLSNVDVRLFKNLVKTNIQELIVLGI